MKATISLKQLRTDPREYIRLLNSGYEVVITEHRQELVRAKAKATPKTPKKGDAKAVLEAIRSLPPIKTPHPEMNTVELIKKTRLEGYEAKRREIEKHAGS